MTNENKRFESKMLKDMNHSIMKSFLAGAVLILALASCNTWKKINYLQDVDETTVMALAENQGIVIQPKDQLSIIVTSRVPSLAAQFNLPLVNYMAGSEIVSTGGTQRIVGYVVDNDGFINFPELGRLQVSGKTRWQLQDMIKDELVAKGLLQDPIVTVEFMNFKIAILGEVSSPGTYSISGDKITIFQALSLARDLTIYGQRDKVEVIREHNGERTIYVLDLRSKEIFDSPAYYLQQDDVIYVVPNSVRAGQSTINENYFKSGSFWISLSSVSLTVINLIVTLSHYSK